VVEGNRANNKKKRAGYANERADLEELFHVRTEMRFIASGGYPLRWERRELNDRMLKEVRRSRKRKVTGMRSPKVESVLSDALTT
jgi:hypothetical protein